ncbi:MAG TPA: dTDP-4-amino-4,6-dideoxygalactose transaminase [Haliscomenobacter sp.]|uniref:dTDP-4-amino-4,6-dideoxygalactose transaminase n=1 Tax=Haliscomenobacter sp. TaxID=2717303 RepID=UPI002BFB75BB|nr:dTDP-4-amino-4,6-dideoxygalactose transaminase [Haliscomenobacter sp.]HOY18055.1 dTDP-4-amino-4,6-dideoxygalactose transaminase [Haliscomenobacter sp.]
MERKIPFNQPFLTGKEAQYIQEALQSRKLAGNGTFTQKCQNYFQDRYHFHKCLLTTSCTDALEMAAILLEIQPGDEVIMPSYTFVSTANPFILRGANVVFADSRSDHPGIDEKSIEDLITPQTKAIVVVHYAGVACDMDIVMDIANRFGVWVVEDAAQAIDACYKGKPLGGIGHLAAFSFHETKNIVCGEGGMLVVNDKKMAKRAEIIWEKGTNRSAFFRGEVDKYGWVDVGSSFLPSEIIAAFLYAQLEDLERIQQKRAQIWKTYCQGLQTLASREKIRLPFIPEFASNNAHMFYILLKNQEERSALIGHLKSNNIQAVFHYLSLHESHFYKEKHAGRNLVYSDQYTDCLLRLPLFFELTEPEQRKISATIQHFFIH